MNNNSDFAEGHIDVGGSVQDSGGAAVSPPVGGAGEGKGPRPSSRNNPGGGAAQVLLPSGFDAIMQQLQLIAASQDALGARVSNVEEIQAQQQQQHQQQQPSHP